MKKFLLLSASLLTGAAGIAQDARHHNPTSAPLGEATESLFDNSSANKTTGLTDTLFFSNTFQLNGPYRNYAYDEAEPFDSGRYYGMNVVNWKGFAQLYRYSSIDRGGSKDTLYNIIGLVSRWSGRKSATSTRQITFNIWRRDSTGANRKVTIPGRNKNFVWAAPQATAAASRSVPITSIVTTNANGMAGNTITYFTAPLANISYDVYAGYTVNYTWGNAAGDTVGLTSVDPNTSGLGTVGSYSVEAGTLDTLISTNTLIQNSANQWKSPALDPALFNGGPLVLFPLIQLNCPLCNDPASVRGISSNDLTFFGTYPNPAVNSTNVRFALKQGADVTITVMDATGRNISIAKKNFGTGDHVYNLSTENLAAGNYVCLIETSKGDGMATQFTVAK
jgi:hypothetical protein